MWREAAGISVECPVRTGRRLAIRRTRTGETDCILGQIHKEAVSPASGHTQASLSKNALFRWRGLSVEGPSSQDAGRQVEQSRECSLEIQEAGSMEPLKKEGWPGLHGEPGPSLRGEGSVRARFPLSRKLMVCGEQRQKANYRTNSETVKESRE